MRFSAELPKQFFYFRERPLLMHTVQLFHLYDQDMQILVGIQQEFMQHWKDLCSQCDFQIPHTLTPGGKTRFHTVKNALPGVHPGNLVGIHDAVRPLLYKKTIDACYEAAKEHGAALPCIELNDSIREITSSGSRTVSREAFRLVQTPQVFQYDILMKGYRQEYTDEFTDDASVIEKAGIPVRLVQGNPENIKITTPGDLAYAEAIFESYRGKSGFFRTRA